MTKNIFVLKGVFVSLKQGLLIFHSSHELDWREIYKPDLSLLEPANFENQTVQQLFLTGLIENLRDLSTESSSYEMKYSFELKPKDQILPPFEPRLKYIEYFKIKTLALNSKLRGFCDKYMT